MTDFVQKGNFFLIYIFLYPASTRWAHQEREGLGRGSFSFASGDGDGTGACTGIPNGGCGGDLEWTVLDRIGIAPQATPICSPSDIGFDVMRLVHELKGLRLEEAVGTNGRN